MAMKRFLVLVVLVFALVLAQCAQREETSSLEITDPAAISCTAGTIDNPGSCCGHTGTGPFCVGNQTTATSASSCSCCRLMFVTWELTFVRCYIDKMYYYSPASSTTCPSSSTFLACEGTPTLCPTCSQ